MKYAVIRNIRRGPSTFTDHVGNMRNLSPVTQKGDTVKILIDDTLEEHAVRKYSNLLKTNDFFVKFSDDVDESHALDTRKKLTIVEGRSASVDKQNRLTKIRKALEEQRRKEKRQDARSIRAKAQAMIQAKKSQEEVMETTDAMKREPMSAQEGVASLSEEEVMDANTDNLKSMKMADLKLIASDLEIPLRKGISKNGLINLILEHMKEDEDAPVVDPVVDKPEHNVVMGNQGIPENNDPDGEPRKVMGSSPEMAQ